MLISETREQALARVGRALADPTRCRLLLAVVDGVSYPAHLADHLKLSRANVSNHLACLRDCGLVTASYEGRRVRYEVADAHLAKALTELAQVVLAVTPTDQCLNESQPSCACAACAAEPAPEVTP
ncbi:Cd(II)/Pb(II)-sensing metalloregulatory transcriptional regulator CmtR [Phytoactinopolyspora mesophila]|uniref:Metalloregulator ArsR/SmtB family transcription factor n=1 Tax=Phytoactinopolyspora mesophila TaxID=2650750 RepID=A0A7K3LYV3_9ACTN|nr:metalloregulator ArsR/SmtB family transcription factor [Phytoactinopolyspora mesophila]NDL56205.1 metalloregulator ArsR/SmtB family transcription factor [Phytoactinopolyspora mesophila]